MKTPKFMLIMLAFAFFSSGCVGVFRHHDKGKHKGHYKDKDHHSKKPRHGRR